MSKLQALQDLLRAAAPVALGFSGGVDSTFLAAVCARTIPRQTLLVHLETPFISTPEREAFERYAGQFGVPVITLPLDPLQDPSIAANPPDRCYLCKRACFSAIISAARARGAATVLDGSNADDAGDYRPGMRALDELGVRSPLQETGWTKAEERELLRAWGYELWDMPAGACLATRIAVGEPLSPDALADARRVEDLLHGLGCRQVRARIARGRMRLESGPADLGRLVAPGGMLMRPEIYNELAPATTRALERHVRPYRRGSMNTQLTQRERQARGMWYQPDTDPELSRMMQEATDLCIAYNNTPATDHQARAEIIDRLFPHKGAGVVFNGPVYCDYGSNVRIGDDCFFNYHVTFLDGGPITFGDRVLVGPNCSFYTPEHAKDLEHRRAGYERSSAITIGDDVWLGGGVSVLPGVSIGDGSIIGAGSVVTRDIPDHVIAAGNPCRVIRAITEADVIDTEEGFDPER